MKLKKRFIIIILLLTLLLTGCNNIEKVDILSSSTIVETQSVTYEDLIILYDSGEDFILYISSETCSSCQDFAPIMKSYIETYHVPVFQIESGSLFPTDNQYIPYQFTPTIVIVDTKSILIQVDPLEDENIFADLDNLTDFFNKYINVID